MTVLGVDPGIGRCGWGFVESKSSKSTAKVYGCIETRPGKKVEDRLVEIGEEIESLIKDNKPDVIAVEEIFFGTNSKTAMVVGQARGVILYVGAKNKIPIFSYTPLQVKMALTGYGRADKNQVAQMTKVILKLEKIPKIDDTSDALAVALTHIFSAKMESYK